MGKTKDKFIKEKIFRHLKEKNLLRVSENKLGESSLSRNKIVDLNRIKKNKKGEELTKNKNKTKNIKKKKNESIVKNYGKFESLHKEQVFSKRLQDEEVPLGIFMKKKKSKKSKLKVEENPSLKSKYKKRKITVNGGTLENSEEILHHSLNSSYNAESNSNKEYSILNEQLNLFSPSDLDYYGREDDSIHCLMGDSCKYYFDEEIEEIPKMIPEIYTPKEKIIKRTILDVVHEYELKTSSADVTDPFLNLVNSSYHPENCNIIIPDNYITLECNKITDVGKNNTVMEKVLPVEGSQIKENIENPFRKENHKFKTDSKVMESKFYNAVNSKYVLLHLKDSIYIYGTLKAKLLCGKAEIYGYCLKKHEELTIFSPRGYSLLGIQPLENDNYKESSKEIFISEFSTLFKEDFLQIDIEEIFENFDIRKEALLLLERNNNSKEVKMIQKHMRENLFPPSNFVDADTPHYASEFSLRCKFMNTCRNKLLIRTDWEHIGNKILNESKILVVGGKSVGKSTLIKYILNKNIEKMKQILFIDLDVGQSELFVPQTISATIIDQPLLGPGYFYSSSLKNDYRNKCYFYGDINIVLRPLDYIKLVKTLIEDCHREDSFKNIPWIVNTMGYTEGFGTELMKIIVQILKPTDIIQIQGHKSIHNYDQVLSIDNLNAISSDVFPEISSNSYKQFENNLNERGPSKVKEFLEPIPLYEVHLLRSKTTRKSYGYREWEMTPKDKRLANLLTHFGKFLVGRDEWLTDVRPFCVCADNIEIIHIGDAISNKNSLLDVINANLIYLCRKSFSTEEQVLLECHGLGIVRGIDKFTRKIYIVSTASIKILENINVLALGNGIPLPASIITNQGPKIKDLTPYAYNTKDCISSKQINQYFFRPEHFHQKTRRNILID